MRSIYLQIRSLILWIVSAIHFFIGGALLILLAVFIVDDADARFRHLLWTPLRLPGLCPHRLQRRLLEHDEPAVGSDDGGTAARRPILGARFQVADNEFAIAILRRQGINHPDAVARDPGALDATSNRRRRRA